MRKTRFILMFAMGVAGATAANGLIGLDDLERRHVSPDTPDTAAASELLARLHHNNRQEIMIAELALLKSASPKIRALADRILRDHAFTEKKVQSIARNSEFDIPASAGAPPDLVPPELRQASGSRFDELFLRWMREGHRSAIESMRRLVASVEAESQLGILVRRFVPIMEQHHSLATRMGEG